MPFILLYLIKLSVSLAVVFLFYHFILRKLTFYNHNRWYLLGYTVLAFLIPFINISPVLEKNNWDNRVVNWVPVIADKQAAASGSESLLSTWEILLVIFVTGMVIMFIRLLLQLWSFRRMVQQAKIISTEGMSIYQVDADIIPFSFGNSIFINRHLHREDELQEIISHEFVHVKQQHSLDIIWGELLCLFNWYNPFAWLLRRSIRQNLEFIADNKVLENGVDRKQYQYLLLKVIGNNQFSIASKFNFSSLKKRIAMMNKIRSAKVHLIKFLFVLPVVIIMLLAFRNKYDAKQGPPNMPVVSGLTGADTIPVERRSVSRIPKEIEGISVINVNKDAAEPGDASRKLHGKVLITRKDGGKELYDMGSEESRASFEKKYGVKLEDIAPPPPPPAAPGAPIAPDAYAPSAPPAPPAPVKLPASVKSINVNNNKATVLLKNGQQENYNLNNKEQRAKFEIKYGEFAPPPPPPPPAMPENDLPRAVIVEERKLEEPRAIEARLVGVRTSDGLGQAATTPLYVLDGNVIAPGEVNKVSPSAIASVDVLKGEKAIAAYGDKGKDGVVVIKTKGKTSGVYEEVVVKGYPSSKKVVNGQLLVYSPDVDTKDKKGLIILDGKEVSPEVKELRGTFTLITLTKEEAIKKYGEKGKDGVIEITTVKQ